jgi:hypothetical protein
MFISSCKMFRQFSAKSCLSDLRGMKTMASTVKWENPACKISTAKGVTNSAHGEVY